jgi:hypothetical protein
MISSHCQHKQCGQSLIIFFLVLILAGSAILFSVLDSDDVKIERDKKTAVALAVAKTGLIGYAIGAIGGGQRPGDLIMPDSLTESPANYDGSADSGCLNAAASNGLPLINSDINMRCLGRLPWKDLGLSINGPSESDSNGTMPWYAVSANLVDTTCLTVLNSNTLNLVNNPPPAPLDCSGATLPYPWLIVRDSNGNVISSHVAAIIFIPGVARGAQSRPGSPSLGAADQYLDTLVVPIGCAAPCVPGTYSNSDMNNDFIIASEAMGSTSNFNDQLVYITIEELMAAVEKRAVQEATSQLRSYYLASSGAAANRFYPYAANLGDENNVCVDSKLSGFLPITPASASCASATSCSVSFPMTKVNFDLSAGSYTSKSGSCNKVGNTCTCTGAGSCVKSGGTGSIFTCNADGVCSSVGINPSGVFNFTYNPKTPDLTGISGACTGGSGSVSCSDAGTFSSPQTNCLHPKPGLATLPEWFTDNHWQDVMYYEISNDCNYATQGCTVGNLTVGTKMNNYAIVISAGQKLGAQSRPTGNILDYLDSATTPYGDAVFDAVGTPRSSTYNDQMFIVAP